MTMQTLTSGIQSPFALGRFSRAAFISAAIIPMADYLLYDQPIGLSLFIFAALIAGGAALSGRGARRLAATGLLLLALLPLIESVGPISALVALGGLIGFSLASTYPLLAGGRRSTTLFLFVATGCIWLYRDILSIATRKRRGVRTPVPWSGRLLPWLVPILLCSIFLWLFSSANPVIEQWLGLLNPVTALSRLEFSRVLFWLCTASVVWPFIRPRMRRKIRTAAAIPTTPPAAWIDVVLGPSAILRSLILFNALFAVQSLLDIAYLWNGNTLPDHLSFAAYAHRGAYPLVATALLAGVFLIVATRKGSASERSGVIRWLIHLWTAQNLLLLASSVLRLDLYVAAYSLTYLRFATFIWMLLTAGGLVLILVRMQFGKSNAWLISANLVSLAGVLYACAFVDFPAVVSGYNVRHSDELSGSGAHLDLDYLVSLGPMALPAMDAYILGMPVQSSSAITAICRDRHAVAAQVQADVPGWRGWSLRRWRLDRYLTSPTVATAERQCSRGL